MAATEGARKIFGDQVVVVLRHLAALCKVDHRGGDTNGDNKAVIAENTRTGSPNDLSLAQAAAIWSHIDTF